MADCNCPDDGILEEVPTSTCAIDMKQVAKLAFGTQGKVKWDSASGGGANNGVPQADSRVDTLADWQARRTAVDNTKIIVTPFIGSDPQIEAGEAITEGGGDNTTLFGIEEVTGTNPSLFTATFKSLESTQEVALKKIKCKNTEVYFFNEDGNIICEKIAGTENHKGFNLQSYHFSDRGNAGFGSKDAFTMRFGLPKGWSENLVIVTPADFNPLYDI